jgi:hypothetical protein
MGDNQKNSEVIVNANIDKVWQALTNEDMLTKWYAPNSPWKIPKLAKGEKILFTLMPNAYNSLKEALPMDITIEKVIPHKEFSFSVDSMEGIISCVLEELENSVKVEANTEDYDESLANLKALLEDKELPYI